MPYPEIQTVRLPEFWQNAGTKTVFSCHPPSFLHRYHLKETRINILDDLADCITFSGRSPAFKHNKNRYFLLFDQKLLPCQFLFYRFQPCLNFLLRGFFGFPTLFSIKTPPYAFFLSYHSCWFSSTSLPFFLFSLFTGKKCNSDV